MNGRISKAQYRRPRVRLSKCLQRQLLDALALPSSPVPDDTLPQDSLVHPTKRQLDEIDQPPAKKARLEPADKTPVLHHPKPTSSTRYATFLEKFVDPTPTPRANSEHSFVLEWLESVGSDRDTRCRSDSYLHPSDDSPIPRRFLKSAPEMSYRKHTDGYMVPATPASTGSASYNKSVAPSDASRSSSRSTKKSLVEEPNYRDENLRRNGIHMMPVSRSRRLPDHVASAVRYIQQDRDSPPPTAEDIWRDQELDDLYNGAPESQVESYFRDKILPRTGPPGPLRRDDRLPMFADAVPSTGSSWRVSNPVPDMLYGYDRRRAFPQYDAPLDYMGSDAKGNSQSPPLLYPFFLIEYKASGGNMVVATNQCLGASATCVNIAETLNRRLKECRSDMVQSVNSSTFSVATNGVDARLYISWKQDDLDYYMATVKNFQLQEPEQYVEFRKYVRNIVQWGADRRLKEVRDALDTLLEESRKRASTVAKSRAPPYADAASNSGSSSSKSRKKSSSGRGRGGGSDRSDRYY
ncbi:hypothetical protein ACRE_003730 [Hapsidospora chrysogenum ATCC 11550]|uniref:DUF7924 domain-containing protein n=1 Tax=Hapsidospora chrysogenum (strain ATCC 11550 / CBS 779.69 / DSM 880 / IAM 14645 / JCM 23072 / IMI 49137) TaxID=857340 RepID=A0A086TH15_HAPC1|nr:hypothetical protein ACRE_003730 [Hapsidospora chrysogenum ATCC 11550]